MPLVFDQAGSSILNFSRTAHQMIVDRLHTGPRDGGFWPLRRGIATRRPSWPGQDPKKRDQEAGSQQFSPGRGSNAAARDFCYLLYSRAGKIVPPPWINVRLGALFGLNADIGRGPFRALAV